MALKLYDLSGKDDLRFSPYGWRARMALKHKGLTAEYVPIKFRDKDKLTFSGQPKVPVLVDGDRTVFDSFDIAVYLEEAYPDAPALFNETWTVEATKAWNDEVNSVLNPAVAKIIVGDVFENVDPGDLDYFRETREKVFGKTMETLKGEGDSHRDGLVTALGIVRDKLGKGPFIGGENPVYADYVVFGTMQFARVGSSRTLFNGDEVVEPWRQRMLDLFGGYARNAACSEVG